MYTRVYADVDLDAIRSNVKNLMGLTKQGTKGLAVVKADAYGHGDVAVARALADLVDGYAVATVEEGVNLRNNGIDKLILVLGYVDEMHYQAVVDADIAIPVFDRASADALSECGLRLGKKARCHIKVDTGMGRIGIRPDEGGLELARYVAGLPGLSAEGIFTHFARADESDKSGAYAQFHSFCEFVGKLGQEGISFKYRHCANSAAIMEMPDTNLDMVRLGVAIYGMYPSDEVSRDVVTLRQALSLKSFVTYVKDVMPGETISYGGTYTAHRQMRVATVETGYGDGYPRGLSNKGRVIIHGKSAPIVGRVCMDQFMVDVTEIPECRRGDVVTLIGRDGEACILADELATATDTINYEITCDLGKRIPRRFIRDCRVIGCRDYFNEKWDF
jgi:alanine racemase